MASVLDVFLELFFLRWNIFLTSYSRGVYHIYVRKECFCE